MPHVGTLQRSGVIHEGYDLNIPLQVVESTDVKIESWSMFSVDNPAVVLETVKFPEEKVVDSYRKEVIIRMYESHGSTADVTIKTPLVIWQDERVNILEEKVAEARVYKNGTSVVKALFQPFQVISMRITLSKK
eukprot:GHVN01001271.1.p1 GENE.GHVN01001271.1~~GHVN01001271.1.p1  ORF type:complete len:134 (-),score=9.30 GHVN01001271.1:541-942(-)